MAHEDNSGKAWLRSIDPRRTLGAGAVWLIVALAATFSVSAAVWVGSIARKNVLEQHVRRLLLETDQLSSDLGQGVAERLDALSATGRILDARSGGRAGLSEVFGELTAAYPELDWIGIASPDGRMQSARGAPGPGSDVHDAPWFIGGLEGTLARCHRRRPAALEQHRHRRSGGAHP